MAQKIIIGIHGLGNKPRHRLLKAWWHRAIAEGFIRIGHGSREIPFELAYWADFFYPRPQRLREPDPENAFFIENPYRPAERTLMQTQPSLLRLKLMRWTEKLLDLIFLPKRDLLPIDALSDLIIRKFFKDLDIYYHQTSLVSTQGGQGARDAIRERIAEVIRRHRHKDILLVAHSMGSIIAYDVLTQAIPDVQIHTFVTLGSPLGLPVVMRRFLEEQGLEAKGGIRVPTPENIRYAWMNFSDLRDRIALNFELRDDFAPNQHHVQPVDTLVMNDYEFDGTSNPHKSYGYLRAPQVTQVFCRYLDLRPQPLQALRYVAIECIEKLKEKLSRP